MKSSLLSISAIGNRGHAKSVIDIINKSSIAKVECIYKPNIKKKNKSDLETSDIEKILNSDAIFILSPNDTHFRYLKYLKKNYKGYIYCEKPPVIKINHLKLIEKYSKKIFFNFNLRFSILENLISEINTNEKIVKINFKDCHGLAYKKDIYSKSWRSSAKRHPYGVIETLMIHYIDLCIYLFGPIKKSNYYSTISSKNGTAIDTASAAFIHKNGILIDIFNSYATPAYEKIEIITSESIYLIENNKCIQFYPRDSYDKMGRFIKPRKHRVINFHLNSFWHESQTSSVKYFLSLVKNSGKVSMKHYNTSILSNKELIKIRP